MAFRALVARRCPRRAEQEPTRGLQAQKARVKPPLEPANREFTTLLKMEPNE